MTCLHGKTVNVQIIVAPTVHFFSGCYPLKVQWMPQLFERQEFSYANKSCKIECCGNKMPQIVQNMILSQGLELKLSLL